MTIEPILDSTPFIRWHLALAILAFPLGLSHPSKNHGGNLLWRLVIGGVLHPDAWAFII